MRLSELLGRVEVAAGAASACRPWTKADTHGTSNGAVLHNSNLNIFENNWLPLCKKKRYKVLGFVNVLSTLGCRPDQGRYPRQSCSAQFLPQNVFANACNSCVKDVQSVRCSRCQVFTNFYLQTWPAESAVQSECTKADPRCTLFVAVLGLIWI